MQDPKASEKDRTNRNPATMLGPKCRTRAATPKFSSFDRGRAGREWRVDGARQPPLHGETHAADGGSTRGGGHCTGASLLKQTDFGMKPVKAAGGAVKVKDEIRIEWISGSYADLLHATVMASCGSGEPALASS